MTIHWIACFAMAAITGLGAMLAACGIPTPVMEARETMERSKAAYKDCLEKHDAEPAACESLRITYEADQKAYVTVSPEGVTPIVLLRH